MIIITLKLKNVKRKEVTNLNEFSYFNKKYQTIYTTNTIKKDYKTTFSIKIYNKQK